MKKHFHFRCNEDIFLKSKVLIVLWSVAVTPLYRCIKHFNQGIHKSRELSFNCDKFCKAAPNILGGGFCMELVSSQLLGDLCLEVASKFFFAEFVHPCFSSHVYLFGSVKCSSGHNN